MNTWLITQVQRLAQQIVRWTYRTRGHVECGSCFIVLNDAYWNRQHKGKALPYANLMRMVCTDRKRCLQCALAEEHVEMGQKP